MQRLEDLKRFYDLLSKLEQQSSRTKLLKDCHGKMPWADRGVYFFFEEGEQRIHSGEGLRVVRVGTHAVSSGSKTILWDRLSQHKGVVKTGGGNHRGSVFRKLVGYSLLARGKYPLCPHWGIGSSSTPEIKKSEQLVEEAVSGEIGKMPFLVLTVLDVSSKDSLRAYIEKNSIALLSNYNKALEQLDPASAEWLGWNSGYEKVCRSGLWNNAHVDSRYDPEFLHKLELLLHQTASTI